jgi:hypothetical protein
MASSYPRPTYDEQPARFPAPNLLESMPTLTRQKSAEETLQEETQKRGVSNIARRIHGWSWQAFPIGMGTGAVYVTLSGVKSRSPTLITVETIFYFLNISLFLLNSTTLLLQACSMSHARFPSCSTGS